MCISTERIYVDEEVVEDFQTKLVDLMSDWKVGDGLEKGVRMGPMVHEQQKDHVLSHISMALEQGAKVVGGGEGHHDGFVMPTILSDVSDDMDIMREETFGPVACIRPFKDVQEAIRLSNDNPYGLGATVFGRDEGKAMSSRSSFRCRDDRSESELFWSFGGTLGRRKRKWLWLS